MKDLFLLNTLKSLKPLLQKDGFTGFKKLDEIKKTISDSLGKKIDLAPKNNLSKTAQKYILSEVVYV